MIKHSLIPVFILMILLLFSSYSYAFDAGLFRTIPIDTPKQGILWISNASFYSPITANNVLRETYGIKDSHILSSMTDISLGIVNHVALTGKIPFYADLFSQDGKNGQKSGAGDVSLGLRTSFLRNKSVIRGFSFGVGASIPEKFTWGEEPLGYRTFSTGELIINAEMSLGLKYKILDGYLSTAYRRFPNTPKSKKANAEDIFYDSGYGFLGIGMPDEEGRADVIFHDHLTFTFGTAVPIKPRISGLVEINSTAFLGKPGYKAIVSVAPGFRLGHAERLHINAGIDFRISGPIPDRTYLIQLSLPFIKPTPLKVPGLKKPTPREMARSKNSLVAVANFSKSDIACLYEDALKKSFCKRLESMGVIEVIGDNIVQKSFSRMELVPGEDSPERLGTRLGANYLIKTDISEYAIGRKSSFTVPLVISFPKTVFMLSARASVTDLVTGEEHDLGIISASIKKSRGVNFFPLGASSDLIYLSEPERRIFEKKLIENWVENFNDIIIENIRVFGWEPKRTEIKGDEEKSG
ncbi:MAG: hypothetical protein HOC71_17795 [Candidatus Latescibacteria bacterium]|jgi:hypothetical protein|nr:hypothetical protein [Candidatus Latescibacterota bacterium]